MYYLQAYQSQLLAHRRAVRPGGEGEGLPEGFVDPGSCDVGGGASSEHPPLFRGEDYENGISVVTGTCLNANSKYCTCTTCIAIYLYVQLYRTEQQFLN